MSQIFPNNRCVCSSDRAVSHYLLFDNVGSNKLKDAKNVIPFIQLALHSYIVILSSTPTCCMIHDVTHEINGGLLLKIPSI